MEIKPWKKIGSSKKIAEKYGRSLMLQKFKDPYTGKVEEFSYFQGAAFASVVLAVTARGDVIATKQYRQVAGEILFELPGGASPAKIFCGASVKHSGQLPKEVALREVREETGGFAPGKIISLSPRPIWHDAPCFASVFYPFLFINCTRTNKKARPDRIEYIEPVHIPLSEWIEMCLAGQIVEAKSVVVTALALRHLGYNISKNLP